MEGGKQERESISALMDSELHHLTSTQMEALYQSQEQKKLWSVYHQIGDILRFEHQALSHDFQANMAKRLAQESELVATQEKNLGLQAQATKKLMLIVVTLVVIVMVPSTIFIVKSSFSMQAKKATVTTSKEDVFKKPTVHSQ